MGICEALRRLVANMISRENLEKLRGDFLDSAVASGSAKELNDGILELRIGEFTVEVLVGYNSFRQKLQVVVATRFDGKVYMADFYTLFFYWCRRNGGQRWGLFVGAVSYAPDLAEAYADLQAMLTWVVANPPPSSYTKSAFRAAHQTQAYFDWPVPNRKEQIL